MDDFRELQERYYQQINRYLDPSGKCVAYEVPAWCKNEQSIVDSEYDVAVLKAMGIKP